MRLQEGMFALAPTRRGLVGRAALIAAVGATAILPRTSLAKAPPGAVEYQVPEDPTKEPGRLMGSRAVMAPARRSRPMCGG